MNKTFYSLVLIILSIGLYFTVTADIIAEARLVKSSNDEYEKAIEDAARLIEVREKVLADYNKLSIEDRENLDKLVPKNVDNIRLVIDLNNLATRNGVALTGITIGSSNSNPNIPSGITNQSSVSADGASGSIPSATLEKVSVSFGLTASYQQFINFLQALESSMRILDVNSISLTANDEGLYDWKIDLQTYWLRNQ